MVYTVVASGTEHCVALRSDGTLFAWGFNTSGQTNVPALPPGVTYAAVTGGVNYSLALRNNRASLSLGSTVGLSIGSTTPPPANGGISVAGASSFAAGVSASSFSGSGAGLTNLSADSVTTGTLAAARIPDLDAAKLTTGTLPAARLNGVSGAGLTNLNAAMVTTGALPVAQLPASVARRDTDNAFTAATNSFAGFVGFGTASPGNRLSVAGNADFTGNVGIGTATPLVALDVGLNRVIGTSATDPSGQHGVANRGVKASFGSVVSVAPSEFVGMRTVVAAGTNGCGNSADVTFSTWECITSGSREVVRINGRGNMLVNGSISKAGGSFKIDHPLDPENKFLYHSFVESPDMMNIYNRNVTTDDKGYATITLPDYFEALNRDFRYSLTVVDEVDADEVFLWAKVVRKVSGNQFTVRSSRGELEVSWQVTGVRKDAWAEKNRIPNSVDKAGEERGTLLHPDAFVAAPGKGVAATSELAAPVATDK